MIFQALSLRKISIATVLSLPIVAINIHSASAEQHVFELHNESSIDIHYLFVSNSDDENWGQDILGEDVIVQSGEFGTVTIADDSDACLYDIKAVAADGETSVEFQQVNLCEEQAVTISD